MIIERPNEITSLRSGRWQIVYGRRKTGKTFLVENFIDYDDFFFVKRDRSIIEKTYWREISYETFREILRRDLENGKSVVVDEYHRLGEDFLDYLHALPTKGRLILISSTLHTAKILMGRYSPILGKFGEVKIGLIRLRDTLNAFKRKIKGMKTLVETAVIAREPITINLIEEGKIENVFSKMKMAIPALVGEIFVEEDRHLTEIYEGIIRAVSVGKQTSGKISSYLFSRKLIRKDDPSLIQQYLKNLVDFGILYRIPVWSKNRMVYKHVSPVMRMFFYMDEKYGIGERDTTNEEIKRYVSEIMPRVIEDSLREILSEIWGMKIYMYEQDEFEIDAIYARFKKPEIATEIKWKTNVDRNDVRKAEKNMEKIRAMRKILIVPEKNDLRSRTLEIMDIHDILRMIV